MLIGETNVTPQIPPLQSINSREERPPTSLLALFTLLLC